MTKNLICIVGPTAIGKTALSIEVAQHFNTEIISCDSRQFFKEMNIGTAVPSEEELQLVKHHFIQHKSVKEPYSVGQFEKEAIDTIEKLFKDHDVLVLAGGSGLYMQAITRGLDDFPEIEPEIRQTLNKRLQHEGLENLQNELRQLDQTAYEQIEIDNPHRVIRALEVTLGSGKPYSSFLSKSSVKRPFETIMIGLVADREIIYERINRRVDLMFEEGLLEEARAVFPYKHLNALNTVGYKELFRFIEGEWELDFAISEIKKNTRRFAKRQLTWYRKNDQIQWFDHDTPSPLINREIENQIKKPA
ncbi:MAG: tRNA (adenosine(37)-N6)-dimethylallyltransferase MiaA [Bacteroidia bacterium]|nr:tRNA (adenosine(37)-N6)-dimethylallyltransferase MiaA [Bacteroidia bacterium]MBT8268842.1 tRNA (adenosine(37)-N6)-dimethylallyltransferase MiaA [Bacteroidia bacterium]NNF82775.1 tRNA (adenosine(37)-N6)-dimethylallyltransferase MiaA [Flavobacteriaceae bacterium]NNK70205.1 tRNA (adenosine(37)-N6)-dimethylallyltransferase MiaA [Flavobacteriaceae bacterium]NNL79148.1 tRNA (adenosine(37)-N6)-dimethylallyltransferase MiaA [Flavobacteriaceae bacterium]